MAITFSSNFFAYYAGIMLKACINTSIIVTLYVHTRCFGNYSDKIGTGLQEICN